MIIGLCVGALWLATATAVPQAALPEARQNYAEHYFDAEAHMRLAKALLDDGQPLTAFTVAESARRTQFEPEQFDRAFRSVFKKDQFDNGPGAEAALLRQIDKNPGEAKTRAALADVYLSHSEWKKAESQLKKAMALDPDKREYAEILAEVLRRDGRATEATALLSQWAKAHPESLAVYQERIGSLTEAGSPQAAQILTKALALFPEDAQLHFMNAGLLQKSGDVAAATKEFIRAADLGPKSAFIQGWTGRFFLKTAKDPERALVYYLRAYFLDPDFYDSEYAEGRIRSIAAEMGAARYAAKRQAGTTVSELLRSSDPLLALGALEEASKSWAPALQDPVVELLSADDDGARYAAAALLGKKGDATLENTLPALLSSHDLRVRGAAAYIAGARWKERAVPLLASWLSEPAELIRYDAVSVLVESCGEPGKVALRKYRKSGLEKTPRLRSILDTLDSPEKE